MKYLILTTLISAALCDVSHVVSKDATANILRQELDVSPEGAFQWSFEADNGISAGGRGEVRGAGEEASQIVQGEANWVSPEGESVSLTYVADENGYQPQGSHIPTPPPIPAAILRALEYIRAHPPKPEQK